MKEQNPYASPAEVQPQIQYVYVGQGFMPGLFVGLLTMTLFGKLAAGRWSEALVTLLVMCSVALINLARNYRAREKAKQKPDLRVFAPEPVTSVGDGTTQHIVSR